MKLTSGEIAYILGLKKRKFDWMFEGTLEEKDDGYCLTIYLIKPIYYIVRPILTPFFFIYLVLKEGVKEAKEDFKEELGKRWERDIVCFYLHESGSTSKQYGNAKFVKWFRGE